MATFKVQFTQIALQDLKGLGRWVREIDSAQKASRLLSELYESCLSLAEFPHRGHLPPELEHCQLQGYLEIHQGPYRILYHTREGLVWIDGIFDGRRDLQELLAKRLLH